MKHKYFVVVLLLVVAFAGGIYFKNDLLKLQKQFQTTPTFEKIKEGLTDLQVMQKQIITPPPLKKFVSGVNADRVSLTIDGIISQTNIQRAKYGFMALKANTKLNVAAETKLNDMFNKQYFEHLSPNGTGPGELADGAGYKYIMVGENLALGIFENDQKLVDAWMESPGHRENILRSGYKEMGAAAGKGLYKGEIVWMAVQEFGRPLSDCPAPNENIKLSIDALKMQTQALSVQIETMAAELEQKRTGHDRDYNDRVGEYNAIVANYNAILEELKQKIGVYNAQVNAFNACTQ